MHMKVREFEMTRFMVLGCDGRKYTLCGSANELEVHHIKPIRIGGSDSMENMTTLCIPCHRRIDNELRQLLLN